MQKTIENLTKAFIGESQARNRYTFYASTARKEGYEQIAEIFEITAMNENEHGEWFYKMLNEAIAKSGQQIDPVIVEAEAPVMWKTTADNLKSSHCRRTHGEFHALPGVRGPGPEGRLPGVRGPDTLHREGRGAPRADAIKPC